MMRLYHSVSVEYRYMGCYSAAEARWGCAAGSQVRPGAREGRNSECRGLSFPMASSPSEQQVAEFVRELVSTGAWLDEVMQGLCVELPRETFAGKNPRTVLYEMLSATIGPALQSADAGELQRATEFIDLAASRVEEDLRLAAEWSRRTHGEDRSVGRA